jgi:DNA-binding NtrC family response regulator
MVGESFDTLTIDDGPGASGGSPPVERFPLLVQLLCADDIRQASVRQPLAGFDEVRIFRSTSRRVPAPGRIVEVAIDDRYASNRHLLLVRERGGWTALDQGSTNGTLVDGERLAVGERFPLPEAALIEIGHTFFLFRAAARGIVQAPDRRPEAPEPATLNPEWELELARVDRLAPTRHEVLIEGETGSGKEVLARLLHTRSGRRGPLVSVNCAALPEGLLDDELFGHVRGAFSGAQAERQGLVRAAHQGTLFLDEIGEMSPALQAKLLRVIEDGKVRPIGSERELEVDVRFVAATHCDLRALAAQGKFRQDLLARLGLLPVRVPPLRERREDLGLLIRDVLRSVPGGLERARFELEALRLLLRHRWPLNVRELRHVLSAAVDLAPADPQGTIVIAPHHLTLTTCPPAPTAGAARPRELTPEDCELRDRIAALLQRHAGNVAAVARAIGKPRTHVQRQMARLGLERSEAARHAGLDDPHPGGR